MGAELHLGLRHSSLYLLFWNGNQSSIFYTTLAYLATSDQENDNKLQIVLVTMQIA